jgi:hypothetical protein
LRSGLFLILVSLACLAEPTTLSAQGQSLTIVFASPLTGPLICKPGYGEPQCWAQAFDMTKDLAFQGNGFVRPTVAKDDIPGYPDIHQPEFANDGSYGNGASWISDSPNSWLKVDLGRTVLIDHITIGRDRLGGFDDRDPGQFIIAVATADNVYANGDGSNDGAEYTQVFNSASFGFSGVIDGPQTIEARFTPVLARFIKLSVENVGTDIDEIEVFAPPHCVSPPSGLVGWWPGDGNANDIVAGNNGTLQGNVTFVPGMVGQAFSFDGSSYVDASDSNLPVGNSSATISAWIKTTQSGEPFFVSWGSRDTCGEGHEIALGMWNNLLELETCGGADNTSAIVNDGAWHHVAAVWYGSDNATLYVDGVSSSYPHPQPLPSINILSSGHLNIGQLVQYGANFIGLVNEVQIFNRPLSASEIQAIFNAGSTGLCRYAGQVQPPINADGTSIFTVRRGVVPVKFTLTQGGVATCDLPPATIAVTRTGGGVIGQVNESTYTGSADSGSSFRIDSCRYIYNLNSRALGVGIYRVDILINGQVVGSATFELR